MSADLSSYIFKVAKGDKESFRFIANSMGYKMHATAIKILGSSHFEDADDVVQISLIKVWQLAPNWVNKGSVEGYIHKIVFYHKDLIYIQHLNKLKIHRHLFY